MQLRSNVSPEEGQKNFRRILSELGEQTPDWNEANTRFHIVDRLLIECLGWQKTPDIFKLEEPGDNDYRDYLLGSPALTVWEAKRSGNYFDFPADIEKRAVQSIQSIFAVSRSAEAAIRQVQGYCNDSGVEIAVVCNGHQLIAFVAVRVGQSWLKGNALVIRSLQHLDEEFGLVWQCLSPDGVAEKRLFSLLTRGSPTNIPRKLSTLLIHYPSYRYKTSLQTTLRTLAELLLVDALETEAVRPQFYKECYCDTGALSRDALISEKILQARYAALFPPAEDAPQIEPAAQAGATPSLSNQILTEALARRPIVLLGDVGVGKTSFLEDLMHVRAPAEFDRAIHIYIDLGSKAALAVDIRSFVIGEIERQLFSKYGVDIQEHNFVRGVYDLEIKRFRSSFKAVVYKSNKAKLDEQLTSRIDEMVGDKPEHLKRSVGHIALARKRQIIIVLDNADQRATEVQQDAFIIAQDFAQNWNALVFIAVRPYTFYQSKRAGALSAYPHKVFTILPPRPELVIEKRLTFALAFAEGRIGADVLQGVKLNISSMAVFLRALLYSLEINRDLKEILANITAGNIRAVVEFVTRFIGSPNVEAEKIVDIHGRSGTYVIPIHEFSKAAILGDYSHFVPESSSSLAMNVFDIQSPDRKEHFLALMVVAYLLATTTEKDRDQFVTTDALLKEMQNWGFLPGQTENALRRLTNKHLIETAERVTFEEDILKITDDLPDRFRATSIGSYHLRRWAGIFAYIDAMVTDTPILDEETRDRISGTIQSFEIGDRYTRALQFRNYLSAEWEASGLRPQYFDWRECVQFGQANFEHVRVAAQRIADGKGSYERNRGRGDRRN